MKKKAGGVGERSKKRGVVRDVGKKKVVSGAKECRRKGLMHGAQKQKLGVGISAIAKNETRGSDEWYNGWCRKKAGGKANQGVFDVLIN